MSDDRLQGAHVIANPDDLVLPFRAETSGVKGRLARLGAVVDSVLRRHAYPEPVSVALGEALVLAALLGSSLKHGNRLTLQTQSNGPLHLLVVDFEQPGSIRGYAGFDINRIGSNGKPLDQGQLFGAGHFAMTIDPGQGMEAYQGVVPLEQSSISDAALTYFRQSEQLPTFIRLAVAPHYARPSINADNGWHWRAGGLMLQHLAREGGGKVEQPSADTVPDDEPSLLGEDDEDWSRTRILAETVEDHELLDPMLTAEQLLIRLFHEEGVRAYSAIPIEERCRCSKERIGNMLAQFPRQELADMTEEDGRIRVTCEFCSTVYWLSPEELSE